MKINRLALTSFCLISVGIFLPGCNNDPPAAPPQNGTTTAPAPAAGNGSPNNPPATKNDNSGMIRTGPDGQKMLVDIPVDVIFFNDPLAVVQEQGTIGTAPAMVKTDGGTTPAETPAETPAAEPDPKPDSPAAGAVAWAEVIPMANLDAEVKAVRNQLAQYLKTVGTYNSNYREIPTTAFTLAALAQIGAKHPDSALWKDKADAMRELSVLLAGSATGTGRAAFTATQEHFEKIQAIFNGSTPTLAEPPEADVPFGDKIEMKPLMYRLKAAESWLTSNTPTASALTEGKEKAAQEILVLKALLTVIADKSYVDDPEYQGYAEETLTIVNAMQDAVSNDNFDKFKENVSLVNSKCEQCHNSFAR